MYQQKWQKITRSGNQSLCGPVAFGPFKLTSAQMNIFFCKEFLWRACLSGCMDCVSVCRNELKLAQADEFILKSPGILKSPRW